MSRCWKAGNLGDFYDVRDGTHDSPKYESNGYPLVTSKNLAKDGLNFRKIKYISERDYLKINRRSKVDQGDVLFAMIGTIGNPTVVEAEPHFAIKNVALLKVPEEQNSHFLKYYLESQYVQLKMQREAKGSTQKFVGLGYLRGFPIRLPPLPEQKRIVAILDEAFKAIATATANTEKNLVNARELFGASFGIITSSMDNGDWKTVTVSDIADSRKGSIRTGPFGSQLLHGEFVDQGIAVLGIDNAVRNDFAWDERRFITKEKFKELARFRAFPDDVIITIMGTCGKCAVIPDDIPMAITSKHLCCISLNKAKCLPEYLHQYFLYHPLSRDHLERNAKGSIMAGLNMGIIKSLPIKLPSIKVQRSILERLSSISTGTLEIERNFHSKFSLLSQLKQSILHKAFTGELTSDPKSVSCKLKEAGL